MHAFLHGGILGRHAESIPPHGVEYIVTLGAHVARNHIAHGIVSHMAHVNAARRIGKHLKDIIFRLVQALLGLEGALLLPALLPVALGGAMIVSFDGHWPSSPSARVAIQSLGTNT